jgi:hypothetical protein
LPAGGWQRWVSHLLLHQQQALRAWSCATLPWSLQVAKQLQQKAWLMHWSLFVFFNHENGLSALIDLFMQDR